MAADYYSAEEDNAIFALRALGWSTSKIAAALERSLVALKGHITRLKRGGAPHPFKAASPRYPRQTATDVPIEGETWTDGP